MQLVTPGARFGALLLEGFLVVVTLGIGWVIWALIAWGAGQTPAKSLLGHVVADARTGRPFTWGRMFVREGLVCGLLGYTASTLTMGLYPLVDALLVFSRDHRTAHDHIAGSVVRHRSLADDRRPVEGATDA